MSDSKRENKLKGTTSKENLIVTGATTIVPAPAIYASKTDPFEGAIATEALAPIKV